MLKIQHRTGSDGDWQATIHEPFADNQKFTATLAMRSMKTAYPNDQFRLVRTFRDTVVETIDHVGLRF